MKNPRPNVQSIDRLGVLFALLTLGFAASYEALLTLAPGLLKTPLWNGSAIPFSVPLGIVAIFWPLLFAWLCVRNDHLMQDGKTSETSKP
jgi:uncharacterized membrane protein (DUF485 family)